MFTTSMASKNWGSLHYIDLFAGAGIEQIKGGGLEWGSPLIAAQAPKEFTQLHLCEKDKGNFETLQERLKQFSQRTTPQLICDDANKAVSSIVQAIPQNSLSLAFLDPFGLDIDFQTLQVLSQHRTDLIVFFPDYLDALRNWKEYPERIDRALGTHDWKKAFEKIPSDRRADVLNKIYVERIKSLGYSHFSERRIARSEGHFLYKLIFFSKHKLGVDLWEKISHKGADGQRYLPFP